MSKEIDIFDFDDYRSYIKARVKSEKDTWGIWTKLAKAGGCQASYLSQSMNGKAHLTPDHILGIANFWNLTDQEKEFLFLILEFTKAGTKALKQHLEFKIKRLVSDRVDSKIQSGGAPIQQGSLEALYCSIWYWVAIHHVVGISKFQTIEDIAKRLFLPVQIIEQCLKQLELSGLVQQKNKKWIRGEARTHYISKDSPYLNTYHNNWRQRAITDAALLKEKSVHHTIISSLSFKDQAHLAIKIKDLVSYFVSVTSKSHDEELVCFTCDFFSV